MKKLLVLSIGIMMLAYLAGCGNGSSGSVSVIFGTPAAADIDPAAPATQALLGGAIQGSPLVFGSPTSAKLFIGDAAGFVNHSTATSPVAKYNRPLAVTTDGPNLYVADYLNNVIRKIVKATGIDTTIAGNLLGLAGSLDSDTTGTAAYFNGPTGVTTDGTYLYVTDSANYTVRRIEVATGKVITLAGTAGQAGHVDALGPAARFNLLYDITINGNYLYVTDAGNTIRMIHKTTGAVSTLAGSPGTTGTADGSGAAARFNVPVRLTTDGPNLYVTDFNSDTIRKIELVTGTVTTIAGKTRVAGEARVDTDGVTGQEARFFQPYGITCDGSSLYVTGSFNNTVRKIVLAGTPGSPWSGPVSTLATVGSAALNSIAGITTDGTGLFLTDVSVDNSSHVIRKIQ